MTRSACMDVDGRESSVLRTLFLRRCSPHFVHRELGRPWCVQRYSRNDKATTSCALLQVRGWISIKLARFLRGDSSWPRFISLMIFVWLSTLNFDRFDVDVLAVETNGSLTAEEVVVTALKVRSRIHSLGFPVRDRFRCLCVEVVVGDDSCIFFTDIYP